MSDRSFVRFALLMSAVIAGAGCTRVVHTGSYNRVAETVVEAGYVNETADFSRYTKLMSDGLEIYYPDDGTPPPPEDIERIRQYFRAAFLEAIGDDYPVVTESGPDVLLVKAQLVDVKINEGGAVYDPSGRLRDIVAHGELTFLMTMSDSSTGDVLARAADKYSDISADRDDATWQDVRRAAEYWAGLFRNWLDRSLGRAAETKETQ